MNEQTPMQRFLYGVTGAKFMLCFGAMTGSMIGALMGWLSGAQWVTTVNITLTIFAAGNVAATHAHGKSQGRQEESK